MGLGRGGPQTTGGREFLKKKGDTLVGGPRFWRRIWGFYGEERDPLLKIQNLGTFWTQEDGGKLQRFPYAGGGADVFLAGAKSQGDGKMGLLLKGDLQKAL